MIMTTDPLRVSSRYFSRKNALQRVLGARCGTNDVGALGLAVFMMGGSGVEVGGTLVNERWQGWGASLHPCGEHCRDILALKSRMECGVGLISPRIYHTVHIILPADINRKLLLALSHHPQ